MEFEKPKMWSSLIMANFRRAITIFGSFFQQERFHRRFHSQAAFISYENIIKNPVLRPCILKTCKNFKVVFPTLLLELQIFQAIRGNQGSSRCQWTISSQIWEIWNVWSAIALTSKMSGLAIKKGPDGFLNALITHSWWKNTAPISWDLAPGQIYWKSGVSSLSGFCAKVSMATKLNFADFGSYGPPKLHGFNIVYYLRR